MRLGPVIGQLGCSAIVRHSLCTAICSLSKLFYNEIADLVENDAGEADTIPTDSVPTDAIPIIRSHDDPVHL